MRTLYGIQDQDHSVIIVKSVKCQPENAGHDEERRSFTYLLKAIYIIRYSVIAESH